MHVAEVVKRAYGFTPAALVFAQWKSPRTARAVVNEVPLGADLERRWVDRAGHLPLPRMPGADERHANTARR